MYCIVLWRRSQRFGNWYCEQPSQRSPQNTWIFIWFKISKEGKTESLLQSRQAYNQRGSLQRWGDKTSCTLWLNYEQHLGFSNKEGRMSNFCVFVHLLFIFNLSPSFVFSDTHYNGHIPCSCTNVNNSLCVSCVFMILAFDLFRFLKILFQIFEHMHKNIICPFVSLIVTCCYLFIKSFCNATLNSSLEHSWLDGNWDFETSFFKCEGH